MTLLDYLIIAVIVISCIVGTIRGLIKEVFSLGAWVLAFIATYSFSSGLSALLAALIQDPTIRYVVAVLSIFILTLFLCGLVNSMLYQGILKIGLTGTDRLLGVLFGALRGVFIVVILMLFIGLTPIPRESWWQASQLPGHFVPIAKIVRSRLPDYLAQNIILE